VTKNIGIYKSGSDSKRTSNVARCAIYMCLISQDAKVTVFRHPVTLDYSLFSIQWTAGRQKFGVPVETPTNGNPVTDLVESNSSLPLGSPMGWLPKNRGQIWAQCS